MRIVSLIAFFIAITGGPVFGCSCHWFRGITAETLLFKDVIFKGKILYVDTLIDADGVFWKKATFQIIASVKPRNLSDTISIYTAGDGPSACGLNFEKGHTWLIIAAKSYFGVMGSSECDESIREENNDDEARIDGILKKLTVLQTGNQQIHDHSSSIEGKYEIFGQMENGIPFGRWLRIRGSDTIAIYNFKNGERYGMQMEIDEDSYPSEKSFQEFVTGEQNGIHRYFDEYKKLRGFTEFKDGMSHGRHEAYDENGKIFQQGQFINGRMDGTWTGVYHDGVRTVETYVNGRLKLYLEYDNKGNLIERRENK